MLVAEIWAKPRSCGEGEEGGRGQRGIMEGKKKRKSQGRNNKDINNYVRIVGYLASIVKRALLPTNIILQP